MRHLSHPMQAPSRFFAECLTVRDGHSPSTTVHPRWTGKMRWHQHRTAASPLNRDSPLGKLRAARFIPGSSPDVGVVTARYSLKKRENIRLSPDVESREGRN